jgi:hypothetical protein
MDELWELGNYNRESNSSGSFNMVADLQLYEPYYL